MKEEVVKTFTDNMSDLVDIVKDIKTQNDELRKEVNDLKGEGDESCRGKIGDITDKQIDDIVANMMK